MLQREGGNPARGGRLAAGPARGGPDGRDREFGADGAPLQGAEGDDIQASWTEKGRGEAGRSTLQLILDGGVEECILGPEAEDVDVLLARSGKSPRTSFDLGRKVLMRGTLRA